MGRSRNIKPGFFTNEILADMDPAARLLFIGLWTLADREGRLQDRPRRIKAEVLPYDAVDANVLLQALHDNGFVLRYEVDGNKYISIINWHKHQNPHHMEVPSEIPPPPGSTNKFNQTPVTKAQRQRIFERDNFQCVACGATDNLSIDHIIPVSKGGNSSDSNLRTLCLKCNMRRGNRDVSIDDEPTTSQEQLDDEPTTTQSRTLIPDSLILIPDSLILIPDSLILDPDHIPPPAADEPPIEETEKKPSKRVARSPSDDPNLVYAQFVAEGLGYERYTNTRDAKRDARLARVEQKITAEETLACGKFMQDTNGAFWLDKTIQINAILRQMPAYRKAVRDGYVPGEPWPPRGGNNGRANTAKNASREVADNWDEEIALSNRDKAVQVSKV